MEDDRTGTAATSKSHSAERGNYEVEAFAKQFGISIDQARNLIDKFGNNKQVLHREAWKLQDGRSIDLIDQPTEKVAELFGPAALRRAQPRAVARHPHPPKHWPRGRGNLAERGHAMKKILLTILAVASLSLPAAAVSLSKTYSYFSVGGRTLEEIETDLDRKGPRVRGTGGRRHPSATQIEFTTRITYAEGNRGCVIAKASVSVKTKTILPRWRLRATADDGTRLVWDTLLADIKRHEETHVMIAKNHARDLELALRDIRRQRDCKVAATKAKAVSEKSSPSTTARRKNSTASRP